jgi:hypothetical protein
VQTLNKSLIIINLLFFTKSVISKSVFDNLQTNSKMNL